MYWRQLDRPGSSEHGICSKHILQALLEDGQAFLHLGSRDGERRQEADRFARTCDSGTKSAAGSAGAEPVRAGGGSSEADRLRRIV